MKMVYPPLMINITTDEQQSHSELQKSFVLVWQRKKKITDQEIMDRIFQLEMTKIHFQGLFMPNNRVMDSNEMEITANVIDLIDQEINWLQSRGETMIADQEIIDRILQLRMKKLHFQGILMPNDRVMDSNEMEITANVIELIDQEINWLRGNLS